MLIHASGSSKARRVVGVERLSGTGSWSELIDSQKITLSAPSFSGQYQGAEKLVELIAFWF